MKKIFSHILVSLGAVLGFALITNLGSPTVKGVVSWLNPPEAVLSVRGQQLADSLDAGDGWLAKDNDKLVHPASGLELSVARKDEKDLGNLKIASTFETAVQPKYSASDLKLLRVCYEKRLAKIEDEYEANRNESLRRPKQATKAIPTQPEPQSKLRVLIPIVPPIGNPTNDEPESIPAPNNK